MTAKCIPVSLAIACCAAPFAAAGQNLTPGRSLEAVVAPYDSTVHPVVVTAGTTLTISVRGRDAAGLDVFVFDDFGNLLASSTDGGDVRALTISTERPGVVRIEVRNRGGDEHAYVVEVT